MNTNIEKSDQQLFNRIAKKYFQKDISVVSSRVRRFQLLSLVALCNKKFPEKIFKTVLELGCGVGANANYLNGKYEKYIGVDYSEKFIELAKTHFENKNNLYFCENIKAFQIDDNEIDFVYGVGVLHHVDNISHVLQNINKVGNPDTVFGFIEPQSSNPIIQIMRRLRMLIDKNYSNKQVFFRKKDILNVFNKNGFEVVDIKYQGYFTPPFAQIIIKPTIIFKPLVKFLILIDKFIQCHFNNRFAWNIMWIATKK